MSDAPNPAAPDASGGGESKAPLLFALLNTLGLLGATGVLYYTRMAFKRPPITEVGERNRLSVEHEKPKAATKTGVIPFDVVTVNIRANPAKPGLAEGTSHQVEGKLHYASVAFTLEILDEARAGQINDIKPLLMDRFLQLLGNKAFHDLNTVQGRYVLRSQIQDMANDLIKERGRTPEDQAQLVSQVYLTHFTVQ